MKLFAPDAPDPRDQIIADQRAEISALQDKLIALVDAKAATILAYQKRMVVRERSDPNAMPRIPNVLNIQGPPKVAPFETDEQMEAAFRGSQ